MKQYIDKSALVAEIEKRVKEHEEEEKKGWAYSRVKIVECEHILSFINTLEVKEVDLEKEWKEFLKDGDVGFKEIAQHFFELGMTASNKAQKENRYETQNT